MTSRWTAYASAGLALACASAVAAEPDIPAAVQRIYAATNELRTADKLPALSASPKLEAAAGELARYMAATGRYGHEADGQTAAERARRHDYDHCIVAENIAYQFDTAGYSTERLAGAFFHGWRQSPPHRTNMLDADVTESGAAVARSERSGYYYAVHVFGRPASAAVRFAVVNEAGARIRYVVEGRTYALERAAARSHTRCRASPVVFRFPGGEQRSLTPGDGARYTVTAREGRWHVEHGP